jgi:hypothetical protein
MNRGDENQPILQEQCSRAAGFQFARIDFFPPLFPRLYHKSDIAVRIVVEVARLPQPRTGCHQTSSTAHWVSPDFLNRALGVARLPQPRTGCHQTSSTAHGVSPDFLLDAPWMSPDFQQERGFLAKSTTKISEGLKNG